MSVYKRGSRWYFYIRIREKRYRGALPEARLKSQALEAERKIRDQIFAGNYKKAQSGKTRNVKEFVEEVYLPWAKDSKRSWRNDQSRAKAIVAHFGKRKFSEITPFDVEKFKLARSKSKVVKGKNERTRSIASVNREIALLSRIFTLAKKNGEANFNPVSEVKFFRGEGKRTRYLLPEEEEKLFAQFTGKRMSIRLIVLVALNTGMRLKEILELKRSDVDFHRDEIHITKTKTFRSRVVPMNATVRTELLDHMSRLESDHLFFNPKLGKARVSVQHAFHSARTDAGLEDFHFHDLRHTAATRMAERGIDPFTIAAILGHANIRQTASYAHATQQSKRLAVAALEAKTENLGHNTGHNRQSQISLAAVK